MVKKPTLEPAPKSQPRAFIWEPGEHCEPLDDHAALRIGICLSGCSYFYFGNKRYHPNVGDVLIANHLELHLAQSDLATPSRYLFISFHPDLLLQEDAALLLPFAGCSEDFLPLMSGETAQGTQISELINQIALELDTKDQGYQSMVKGLLFKLSVLLLRAFRQTLKKRDWLRISAAFRRLRPALDLLESDFRKPLELADVAQALDVSPSQTSRLFQQEFGYSFKQYLLRLRMNEAKRLLLLTAYNMTEIGSNSGFQSTPSFYRLFKQQAGLSPLEYRQRYSRSKEGEKQGLDGRRGRSRLYCK